MNGSESNHIYNSDDKLLVGLSFVNSAKISRIKDTFNLFIVSNGNNNLDNAKIFIQSK